MHTFFREIISLHICNAYYTRIPLFTKILISILVHKSSTPIGFQLFYKETTNEECVISIFEKIKQNMSLYLVLSKCQHRNETYRD